MTIDLYPFLKWISGPTAAFVNKKQLAFKSDIPAEVDTYTKSEIDSKLSSKANSTHNHSASNITSGTLPPIRGGTGLSSNPSILVNLASTRVATLFSSSPRPGVSGVLPLANGGTGVTSLEALKTALGISDTPGGSDTSDGNVWIQSGSSSYGAWNLNTDKSTIYFMIATAYAYIGSSDSYSESYLTFMWHMGMGSDRVQYEYGDYLEATVSGSSIIITNQYWDSSAYIRIHQRREFDWLCIGV